MYITPVSASLFLPRKICQLHEVWLSISIKTEATDRSVLQIWMCILLAEGIQSIYLVILHLWYKSKKNPKKEFTASATGYPTKDEGRSNVKITDHTAKMVNNLGVRVAEKSSLLIFIIVTRGFFHIPDEAGPANGNFNCRWHNPGSCIIFLLLQMQIYI